MIPIIEIQHRETMNMSRFTTVLVQWDNRNFSSNIPGHVSWEYCYNDFQKNYINKKYEPA